MINIDVNKIEESLGPLQGAANDDVIEVINQLAAALLPLQGDNELVDQAIEQCKAVQDMYNAGFLTTLEAKITEFKKVIDIGEWLQKSASVGTVTKIDTGAETGSIDADAVMV